MSAPDPTAGERVACSACGICSCPAAFGYHRRMDECLASPPAVAADLDPSSVEWEVHRLMMLALHGDRETLAEELTALVDPPCRCGHGQHLHDREAVPPLCMECGDLSRCEPPAVAASTGTSEDVEALARALRDVGIERGHAGADVIRKHWAEQLFTSDWLAAREAAARAEANQRADTAFLVGARFGRESERERIAREGR